MSNLRIFGLIIGICGLIATFLNYRGPKWKRSNFIFFSLFNIFLVVVSSNPNVLNVFRDMLALQNAQRGRILALLVISNMFLLFVFFYTKSRLEDLRIQFDKLVRNLGGREHEERHVLSQNLKPIMVLIPAFNEEDNLRDLLPRIPKEIKGQQTGILVVDDGSEDNTAGCHDLADNVIVVKNIINRGGGAALRLGYDILKKSGTLICVTMDADGQHRPEEMEKLIMPILEDQYDFVIGSRILGKREKDNPLRYVGVLFFGRIISLLLGLKITDPSCGFRAFRMKALSGIDLYEDQFHTSELIIDAVKKRLRVGEVPITVLKRKYGKSKKGTDWKYGLNFAKTIIRAWWR